MMMRPRRRDEATNAEDAERAAWLKEHQSFEFRRAHAPQGHGDALEIDFQKSLNEVDTPVKGSGSSISLDAVGGRYRRARKELRRAQVAHEQKLAAIDDAHSLQKANERLFEARVKLSGTTGVPTLRNRAERQLEVARLELERERRGEVPPPPLTADQEAVGRTHVNGEFVCPAAGLTEIPPGLANTLTMQLGITRVVARKNTVQSMLNQERSPHLHTRNYLHVTDIDLQENEIKRLPDDFGLLCRLKRLNLKRNHLGSLPGSFTWLDKLVHFDLTENLFTTLPEDIGKLKSLETFIVSKNSLIEVPATIYQLRKLTKLDLSSNGLCHLAIKPPVTHEPVSVTEAWEEMVDPTSKKVYYYNSITGLSRGSMPPSLKQSRADAKSGQLQPGSKAYNDEKRTLAGQGIAEWDAKVDAKEGSIYYQNNVNGSTSWEMPAAMDVFGKFPALVHLNLTDNNLRNLPESCANLSTLEVLEAKNNFLSKLPLNLGNLTNLRQLKVSRNELTELPHSMSGLVSLKELVLTSNHLTSLSPWIGDLPKLEKLFLGNNNLDSLPPKLGFATKVTELQVYNNPITFPPYELIEQGMDAMMHALRSKYLDVTRGPAPVMKPHFFGAMDENVELEPEFAMRITKAVDEARESHELLLFLAGLHEMPTQLEDMEELHTLKLHGNHLGENPPYFFHCLTSSLTTLSLKTCELVAMDDSLCTLSTLKDLCLEDNSLERLPEHFSRLRKLEVLNLSKNRLFTLPDDLGTMTALKRLNCDMNRLDLLPDTLPMLRNLKALHCDKNCLYRLPDGFTGLTKLEVLSLEANQIYRLPPGLGNLHLVQLKLAHNRIERLEATILAPNLRTTIEVLRLANNNLLELPALFNGVDKLRELTIEYNPMRSPTTELLPEPLHVIIQYCNVRAARVTEVKELLDDFEFESDTSHFTPTAHHALTGKTGYLTPDDLADFDVALDAYVNGSFYKCPVGADDMVDKIDRLREERKFVFYNMLLQETINVLEEEMTKKGKKAQFSRNVLVDDIKKPWGRNGELVSCFAVSMDALLQDTEPNKYVRKFRPSLWESVKEHLPITIFEYTQQMLTDAIEEFESVWEKNRYRNQPIAMVDKCEFPKDEVILPNGKERRLVPCEIPTLYIVKVIYTSQEKRRRREEDEAFWSAFRKTEDDVVSWVDSKGGKALTLVEIKARNKRLNKDLQATAKIRDQMVKQLDAAKDMMEAVNRRRADYDAGKPVHMHKIHNDEEAVELVTNAEDAQTTAQKAVEGVDEEMREIRAKIKMKRRDQIAWVVMDVQRKSCHQAWKRVLTDQRSRARRRGWRRPWDGEDGSAFKDWCIIQDALEEKATAEMEEEEEEEEQNNRRKKDGTQPFNFENLLDMEQYDSEAYHRYLTTFRPDGLLMPWIKNMSDPNEGDEEGAEEDLEASEA